MARKAKSYEGSQYRGGRSKGRKNLVKLPGGAVQNQYGVDFTENEKKALERAVNKANRTRKKMIAELGGLPTSSGGTVGQLLLMGKENDFIISRKSKSLQQFKSRESFESYIKNLERVNSPTYLDDRARLYKRNLSQAIKNAYGYEDSKDILMKIRTMKPREFMKLVATDETLEISYMYNPNGDDEKLNEIRDSLGMKLKDY